MHQVNGEMSSGVQNDLLLSPYFSFSPEPKSQFSVWGSCWPLPPACPSEPQQRCSVTSLGSTAPGDSPCSPCCQHRQVAVLRGCFSLAVVYRRALSSRSPSPGISMSCLKDAVSPWLWAAGQVLDLSCDRRAAHLSQRTWVVFRARRGSQALGEERNDLTLAAEETETSSIWWWQNCQC